MHLIDAKCNNRFITSLFHFASTLATQNEIKKNQNVIIITLLQSMHALFNPKAYFHFLNVNFTLSAIYELLKSTATLSTFFTLYDVWNAF